MSALTTSHSWADLVWVFGFGLGFDFRGAGMVLVGRASCSGVLSSVEVFGASGAYVNP